MQLWTGAHLVMVQICASERCSPQEEGGSGVHLLLLLEELHELVEPVSDLKNTKSAVTLPTEGAEREKNRN